MGKIQSFLLRMVEVVNNTAGYLSDSCGMLAMLYVNDKYREQRKAAGVQGKVDNIIVFNSLLTFK